MILLLDSIFIFVIALGVWGLYKVVREALNQHIRAMEAVDERLAGIERALQTLANKEVEHDNR